MDLLLHIVNDRFGKLTLERSASLSFVLACTSARYASSSVFLAVRI